MTMQVSTLRPGLLVSLKSSLRGNVSYNKETIENERVTESGAARTKWETERTISDPKEYQRAIKARSKARSAIRGVCAHSAFGLLCPENQADVLENAIRKAREITDEFNSTAQMTRVNVYVMTGRIAPDDVEAVKSINSEIRDLMEDMAEGLKNLDVKVVRDAANRAKSVGTMLSADAQERVKLAIDTARASAKAIVKAGEQAAQEIDAAAIRKITDARTAFLDLDEVKVVQAPAAKARAVDLAPEAPKAVKPRKAKAAAIELN